MYCYAIAQIHYKWPYFTSLCRPNADAHSDAHKSFQGRLTIGQQVVVPLQFTLFKEYNNCAATKRKVPEYQLVSR
jgi:hypothetical protein